MGPLLVALAACGVEGGGSPDLPPPVVLADAGASNPTTAVDRSTGTALIAWVETDSAAVSDVHLARLLPDGTFEGPVRVNDRRGDAAPHFQAPPRVAAGPGGAVYVVWQNSTPVPGRRFPASDLRFARSADGGRSFGAAITVNDDAGGPPASHTFHDMIVAPDGSVVVSWLDGRDESGAGGGGSGETAADGDAAGVGDEAAVHGGHGEGEAGPAVRVAVSRDDGRTFGPGVVVDRNTCPCCRTDLAAAPDGTLYVSWRKVFEGDVRDVVVARSTDGGRSWGEPRRVHADDWVFPGCPHAGPAVATGDDGTLHVAWYTGAASGPGVYYTRSDDGGRTFAPPAPLLAEEWVPPSQVELAVAEGGRLWTSWEDRTREPARTLLTVVSEGGDPGGAPPLDLPGLHPSLAPAEGRIVVAWLSGDSVLAVPGRGR